MPCSALKILWIDIELYVIPFNNDVQEAVELISQFVDMFFVPAWQLWRIEAVYILSLHKTTSIYLQELISLWSKKALKKKVQRSVPEHITCRCSVSNEIIVRSKEEA